MSEKKKRINSIGKTDEEKKKEQAERTKKSKEGKSPINFDVYEEDKKALKEIASEHGESVAEYITTAVNQRAGKQILTPPAKRGTYIREREDQKNG